MQDFFHTTLHQFMGHGQWEQVLRAVFHMPPLNYFISHLKEKSEEKIFFTKTKVILL